MFLDEIGAMSINLQAKLLRVLEDETFTRVGGTGPIQVDVRVIAATNRDLEKAIEDGTFRADLYYRLNVISVHLPPLRDRRDDLPFLINHFLETKGRSNGLPQKHFSREAMSLLMAYQWPGNVREMENSIERAIILSGNRLELLPEDLSDRLNAPGDTGELGNLIREVLAGRRSLGETVDFFEQQVIERGLGVSGFNQTRAAEILGTTRRILKYKIDRLGIQADSIEDEEPPPSEATEVARPD